MSDTVEQWAAVRGFEHSYYVSSLGRVWSNHQNKLLTPVKDSNGHLFVNLQDNRRKRMARIRHLVLENFVGPKPKGFVAAYKDGDSSNVCLDNLKWASMSEVNYDRTARHEKKRCSRGHLLVPSNLLPSALKRNRKACKACGRAYNEIKRLGGSSGDMQEVSDKHYLKIIKLGDI